MLIIETVFVIDLLEIMYKYIHGKSQTQKQCDLI